MLLKAFLTWSQTKAKSMFYKTILYLEFGSLTFFHCLNKCKGKNVFILNITFCDGFMSDSNILIIKWVFINVTTEGLLNYWVVGYLSDCNWTRTHNHFVHKRIWPVGVNGWKFVCELRGCGFYLVQLPSLKLQISRLPRARSSFTFRQLQSVDSFWNAYVTC